ncbi:hypothetical protein C7H19_18045 [Aphanothece hegewaldii CCALA 016]|uniref:DUF2808 domain-containing protein n=1 Tax=Aphanothece hegewaldii CCALA 016 TaxID=2107694 RepID=A0A2T1LUA7_9CHRO|nr:DUF2808 domain-containing protein [Aphanothece hegewaldii]PSF35044.1 hypothetical protein C7H19_18045 [Aphanothece hegewaldii CCALA 016]
MRFLSLFNLTVSAFVIAAPSVLAQEMPFPANSSFFTGDPPTLMSADTPDSLINWPSPHYFFTFNVPANSKESLGKVTIAPEISGESIAFDLSKTQAFQGTRKQKGQGLTLQSVTQDPKTQVITIVFAPSVPQGTTFTISLQAVRNPSESGEYIFRVQGFPSGDNPIGLDLGVGRLSFYRPF